MVIGSSVDDEQLDLRDESRSGGGSMMTLFALCRRHQNIELLREASLSSVLANVLKRASDSFMKGSGCLADVRQQKRVASCCQGPVLAKLPSPSKYARR